MGLWGEIFSDMVIAEMTAIEGAIRDGEDPDTDSSSIHQRAINRVAEWWIAEGTMIRCEWKDDSTVILVFPKPAQTGDSPERLP